MKQQLIETLENSLKNVRETYVQNIKQIEDPDIIYNNISYYRIPFTEKIHDTTDTTYKTEIYGNYIYDESGRHYVEIEFGKYDNDYYVIDNNFVKKTDIKCVF